MGFINLAEKTINAKLVYYGVGMGGKTTSLQAVHKVMCPRNEVQLVSINTEEDSTLLFDFLPIDLGQIEGFKIRIQGFTVPGQPKYKLMRKYVLSGADAVVFVVDSQRSRLEENQQALDSLYTNLKLNGLDPTKIPVVLQYNKRDLDDILSEKDLDQQFRSKGDLASFPSVAKDGQGVFETFVHAAGLLIEAKVKLYKLGKGGVDPKVVAEGARQRLWELHAQVRTDFDKIAAPSVAVKVPDAPLEFASDEQVTLGEASKGVLSEAELDVPLAADVDFAVATSVDVAGDQAGLLDKAVQSGVELARKFGDLDSYRSLLERKNRELVEVAQNTVHDLRKPLTAIAMVLKLADRGSLGEVQAPLKAAIKNGLDAVKVMEHMLEDLNTSSQLDFDGLQMEFKELDPTLVVAGALQTLRYEIEERGANVTVEQMPRMKGDEWALTKVFLNLIGNALQYADPDRRPAIRIACEPRGDRFVFSVQDNGIGIPDQDLGKLFQRFKRGSNVQGIAGTGLGLHIVKEMVLGHGGEVWVESRQGQGTKFLLAIPKQPVQPGHSTVSSVG